AAGYGNATTTRRGCADAYDDRFLLPRIPVAGGVGAMRLWFKCAKARVQQRG
ncbi:polysaccharide deacetylase family protein, partial [Burkholderia contaminans]